MRILHVLDHSVPIVSGYSFRSRSLIQAQRTLGLIPVVLTSPKQGVTKVGCEEVEGITHYRTNELSRSLALDKPFLRELFAMKNLASRIAKVVSAENIDVIHSHSPLLNGLPALWVGRRLGVPMIYEARAFWEDAAVDHGTFETGSIRYRISSTLETFLFKNASRVVTICEGMRQDLLKRGIAGEHIKVVPNGIDTVKFTPQPRADWLARQIGVNEGPVFGFVGSFYRYEGLRFLIETFGKIRSIIPTARLLLIGAGEEEAALKALALRQSGGVIFTGQIGHERIQKFYSLIDVFVCPRLKMRLTELVTPLKPLESMAMAKAVLASDVGGHRELIKHEQTGLLFEAEKQDDLVKQAVRLARDPSLRVGLGEASRRYVVKERTWEKLVRLYLGLYDDLLKAKGARVTTKPLALNLKGNEPRN